MRMRRFTRTILLSGIATIASLLLLATQMVLASPTAAPVANDDSDLTLVNQTLTVYAPGILQNDSDADGDDLTAALVTAPANGTVSVSADGGFIYTPTADFVGTDVFTYSTSDGSTSDTAAVTIRVLVDNSQPVDVAIEAAGWNLFTYPLYGSRAVTEALVSITGIYTRVFGYDAADSSDPWKMYDTTIDPAFASLLNDLTELDYADGYWILVSQPTTITFSYGRGGNPHPSPLSQGTSANHSSVAAPPATFYGYVTAKSGITPVPNMMVTAWIDGALCGQGKTALIGAQVGYAVHVISADSANHDCGQAGKTVNFEIDGTTIPFNGIWGDGALTQVNFGSSVPTAVSLTQTNATTANWLLIFVAGFGLLSLWVYREIRFPIHESAVREMNDAR